MKLKIGDKYEYILPDGKDVTPQERIVLVNEILNTVLDFDGDRMSVEEYLDFTWTSKPETAIVLTNLSYYISLHHRTEAEIELEKEDRECDYGKKRTTSTNSILSKNEEREMERGFYVTKDPNNRTKNILKKRYDTFSNLDITDKNKLGIDQYKDGSDRKDSSEGK